PAIPPRHPRPIGAGCMKSRSDPATATAATATIRERTIMPLRPRRTACVVTALLLISSTVRADEIRVMTSGASAAAYQALVPEFERTTHHTLKTDAISTGVGADAIPARVRRGDPVDVVMLARAVLDDLIKDGKIVADSRVDLARSSIGIAVRAGAPKPDIGTVDALKRLLLQAKSIAYSSPVSGAYLPNEPFPRLGIAEAMEAQCIRVEGDA